MEIINASVLEDNFTGIVIDGVPHLYWKEIYQMMGIKRNHAYSVLKRLEPKTHFVEFSVSEIKDIYTRVHKPCTLPTTTRYVFLTAEGYHRAIMEISTGYIVDQQVADNIELLKDKMANIYTRYQQGEVLSLAADQHPALSGEVLQPVNDDVEKLKIATSMNTIARRMGASRQVVNKVTLAWIRENVKTDVTAFISAIPDSDVMETPPDDAIHTRQSVAQILKVATEDLEARLIQMRWVTRGKLGWHPTTKGSKYLKSDPHIGEKGFVRYDIKFGLEAIHLLKREFEQQIFTAGYLSSGNSRGVVPVTGGE